LGKRVWEELKIMKTKIKIKSEIFVKIVVAVLVIVTVLAVAGNIYFGLQAKNLNTDNAALSDNITNLADENSILSANVIKLAGELAAVNESAAYWQAVSVNLSAQLANIPSSQQLPDPNSAEVFAFINADNTNEINTDYGLDLIITIENAAQKGIKAYWVVAKLKAGIGYNFVGFKTTDEGWLYFLADRDAPVKLVIGQKYWTINAFPPLDYDDTIMSLHYLPMLDSD
jgi:cell division protein FtsB